ncbi:MAG: restriction endonuclease [Enterococcus faecalis]
MNIIADILALVSTIGLFYVIFKYGKQIHNIINEMLIVLIKLTAFSIYSLTKLGLIFLLSCICLYCIIYVLSELSDLFYFGINRVNWLGILFASAVFYFGFKNIKEKIFLLRKYFKVNARILNDKSTNSTNIQESNRNAKIYPNSAEILNYKIEVVDCYTGYEFEEYIVILLKALGFKNVKRVGGAGDRGIDIIASRDNFKYGFQTKRYNKNSFVGNKAVQEVYTGIKVRGLDKGIVVVSSKYSPDAIGTALQTNIELWDRETLRKHLNDIYYNVEYRDHSLTSKVGYKEKSYTKDDKLLTREQVYSLKPYLEILEFTCNEEISKSDVKKRFRILAKKYHPDKNSGNEQMFKLIRNAYNEIMNKI